VKCVPAASSTEHVHSFLPFSEGRFAFRHAPTFVAKYLKVLVKCVAVTLKTGLLTDKATAEKSKSKFMWNLAYRRKGIDAVYTPHGFDGEAELEAFLKKARTDPDVVGYNVTKPFKESVIPLLDSLDRSAAEVKAVNVIKKEGKELRGYNTDGDGAIKTLQRAGVGVKGMKVVMLGAGGAAKSLAYAIARNGAAGLYIYNRTKERAVELAANLSEQGFEIAKGYGREKEDERYLRADLLRANLVIQATDVGMKGEKQDTPILDKDLIALAPQNCVFFDVVYTPLITQFLGAAKKLGRKIVTGDWMLVDQFALGFKILHGVELTEEDLLAAHAAAGFG